MLGRSRKETREVFGVSNEILPDSYVDRGRLDEELQRLLARSTHVALRGESKCGKSWLRQRVLEDAITIQCRLGKTCVDIYRDALSGLGIRLELERTEAGAFSGRAEASTEVGISLLARLRGGVSVESEESHETKTAPIGEDFSDLRFVADLIKASDRRLVIEDFHYLSIEERTKLAFDLKALWDYGVFVIIVGVWSKQNMLLYLNPDLTGRVEEVAIVWSDDDLRKVFERGGAALNLRFSEVLQDRAIRDCFENVGILQRLILSTLDELGIDEEQEEPLEIGEIEALDSAAMAYAEQLNPLYQQFAERVSGGIRSRSDSTGIYAHAMAVILEASDEDLIRGVKLDRIYEKAHNRESRIQKGNLRIVLEKFEGLQEDEGGRGLVLGYNESTREISAVDRQLLLYRRYSTVKWPWEELIEEAEAEHDDFKVGND
ncbi:MAG TPA: hypothetical protein VF731_09030 [Solirubrobacterales bacterium]